MADRIRHEKNVYYFDFLFVDANEDGGVIKFPSMPQNIKANNALISIDKFILSNKESLMMVSNTDNLDNFIVNIQTNIPCSNYFNSYLVDDGKMDPRTVGFGETIPLQTTISKHDNNQSLILGSMSYVNNSCSRHLICGNPFGNSYTINFYNVQDNGIRDFSVLEQNKILTLRVELLEEEIFR